LNPRLLEAHSLIGTEPDVAAKICSEVLNQNPNDPEALFVLCSTFIKAERWGIAATLARRCTELVPHKYQAWSNLGLALSACNQSDEARKALKKALKIKPDATPPLNNLALMEVHECNPQLAIAYADRSLAINPDQKDVKESRGYAQLMLHNWAEGWEGYEAMIDNSPFRIMKPLRGEPYWAGEKGCNLFVRSEQGIGDEISFLSIMGEARRDNQIVYETDARLEGLVRRSFPGLEVHGTRYMKPRGWTAEVDTSCLVGTFGKHYRQKDEDFPGTPYLVADPERRLQWRALLDTLPGKKIGIAWTGGLANTFRHRRSFNLEGLLPILSKDATWVSLQYKDPTAEIAEFQAKHGIQIHHWKRASEAQDYDETAALVAELDCVVSVTTAAIHLAGALGKKAYVLVPNRPRWWYGMTGSKSVWYDSIELFRQTDKWPVEMVAERL